MDRARQAFSLLDPTGIRPTAIVIGVILALFFGAQLVNALIPARTGGGPGTGPGTGPISGPGEPGQTLPPIGVPTLPPTGPGQPTPGPVPGGSVLEVGQLRIPLEAGWTPGEGPSESIVVRLTKGSAAIDLVKLTVTGGVASPTGLYNGYMQLIGDSDGVTGFANAAPSNIQIGQGLPAARGAYQGQFGQSQIDGEITAFVTSNGDTWVWDAFGAAGTFRALLPEAQRMIDNIQVVP